MWSIRGLESTGEANDKLSLSERSELIDWLKNCQNARKETKSIKEARRVYFEAVIIGRIMEPRLAITIKLERRGEGVVEMNAGGECKRKR